MELASTTTRGAGSIIRMVAFSDQSANILIFVARIDYKICHPSPMGGSTVRPNPWLNKGVGSTLQVDTIRKVIPDVLYSQPSDLKWKRHRPGHPEALNWLRCHPAQYPTEPGFPPPPAKYRK